MGIASSANKIFGAQLRRHRKELQLLRGDVESRKILTSCTAKLDVEWMFRTRHKDLSTMAHVHVMPLFSRKARQVELKLVRVDISY
jgi:hypothetical protein